MAEDSAQRTSDAAQAGVSPGGAPQLSAVTAAADLRRLTLVAAGSGAIGLALCILIGHPLAGVLGFVGLALGLLNAYLLRRAAGMYASMDAPQKSRFAVGALGRLALISFIGLLIAWLTLPDGLGVLAGLAVFQLLLVVMALIPLLRELREAGDQA
jgi:hypothetical protein